MFPSGSPSAGLQPTALRWLLGALCVLATFCPAWASESEELPYAQDTQIGIFEKLGETAPLDVEFLNEEGETVLLRDLVDRPTILTLVYYRCPSICSPLLRELGKQAQRTDLIPGVDYNLVTVSFDITETPELAKSAKKALLEQIATKVPASAWTFLTGDAQNIERLTEGVGFKFKKDDEFVHAGTVIFLTKDGKIVRYLNGKNILPADVKLAVLDAVDGTPRTLIQRVQKICYAYDPEGKTYVLQINRIVLVVTLVIMTALLMYVLLRRRPSRGAEAPAGESGQERAS